MNSVVIRTKAPVVNKLTPSTRARVKTGSLLDAAIAYKGLAGLLPDISGGVNHFAARTMLGSAASEVLGRNAGRWALNNPKKFLATRGLAGLAAGGTLGGLAALASPYATRGLSNQELAKALGAVGASGFLGELAVSPAARELYGSGIDSAAKLYGSGVDSAAKLYGSGVDSAAKLYGTGVDSAAKLYGTAAKSIAGFGGEASSRARDLSLAAQHAGLDASEVLSGLPEAASSARSSAGLYLAPGPLGGGVVGSNLTTSVPKRLLAGALVGELSSQAARSMGAAYGAGTRASAPLLAQTATKLRTQLLTSGVAPTRNQLDLLRNRYQAMGIKIPKLPDAMFDASGRVVDLRGYTKYLEKLTSIAEQGSRQNEVYSTGLGLLAAGGLGGLEGLAGAGAARLAAGDLSTKFSDRLRNLAAAGGVGIGGELALSGVGSGNLLAPVLGAGAAGIGINRLAPSVARAAGVRGVRGLPEGYLPAMMGASAVAAGSPVLGATGLLAAPFTNRRSSAYIREGLEHLKERRKLEDLTKGSSLGRSVLSAPVSTASGHTKVGFKWLGKLVSHYGGQGAKYLAEGRAAQNVYTGIQGAAPEIAASLKITKPRTWNPVARFRQGAAQQQLTNQFKQQAIDAWQAANPNARLDRATRKALEATAEQKAVAEVEGLSEYLQPKVQTRLKAPIDKMPEYRAGLEQAQSAQTAAERELTSQRRNSFRYSFGDLQNAENRAAYEKAMTELESGSGFSPASQFHMRYGNQYGDLTIAANKAQYNAALTNFERDPALYTHTPPSGISGSTNPTSGGYTQFLGGEQQAINKTQLARNAAENAYTTANTAATAAENQFKGYLTRQLNTQGTALNNAHNAISQASTVTNATDLANYKSSVQDLANQLGVNLSAAETAAKAKFHTVHPRGASPDIFNNFIATELQNSLSTALLGTTRGLSADVATALSGSSKDSTKLYGFLDTLLNSKATDVNKYKKAVASAAKAAGITDLALLARIEAQASSAYGIQAARESLVKEILGGDLSAIAGSAERTALGTATSTKATTQAALSSANTDLAAKKKAYADMQQAYEEYLRTNAVPASVPADHPLHRMHEELQRRATAVADATNKVTNLTNNLTAARSAINPTTVNPSSGSRLTAPVTRDAGAGELAAAERAGGGGEASKVQVSEGILDNLLQGSPSGFYSLPGMETLRTIVTNPGQVAQFAGGAAGLALGTGAAVAGTALAPVALGVTGILGGGALMARAGRNLLRRVSSMPMARDLLELRGLPEQTAEMLAPGKISTRKVRALFREAGITDGLRNEVDYAANSVTASLNLGVGETEAVGKALRQSIMRNNVTKEGLSTALQANGVVAAQAGSLADAILANPAYKTVDKVTKQVDGAYTALTSSLSRDVASQSQQTVSQFQAMVQDGGSLFRGPKLQGQAAELAEQVNTVIQTLGSDSPRAASLVRAFDEAAMGATRTPEAMHKLKTELDAFIRGNEVTIALPGSKGTLKLTPSLESTQALESKFNVTGVSGASLDNVFSVNTLADTASPARHILEQSLPAATTQQLSELAATDAKLTGRLLSGEIKEVSQLSPAEIEVLAPGFKQRVIDGLVSGLPTATPLQELLVSDVLSGRVVIRDVVKNAITAEEAAQKALTQATQDLVDANTALRAVTATSRTPAYQKAQAVVNRATAARARAQTAATAAVDKLTSIRQVDTYIKTQTDAAGATLKANLITPIQEARVTTQTRVLPNSSAVRVANPGQGGSRVEFTAEELGQLKQLSSQVPPEQLIGVVSEQTRMPPNAVEEILIRNGIIQPRAVPNVPMEQAAEVGATGGGSRLVAPVAVGGAGAAGAYYVGSRPGRSSYAPPPSAQGGMAPRASLGSSALSAPVLGRHKVASYPRSALSAPVIR